MLEKSADQTFASSPGNFPFTSPTASD